MMFLNRISDFRNLAKNSNAQYGYIVRLHERYQGVYSIEFPQLREAKKDKNVWRNSYADIAYFEALPEALSIINEQARIIFELADKLAQKEIL
jgi:hypothetical protein